MFPLSPPAGFGIDYTRLLINSSGATNSQELKMLLFKEQGMQVVKIYQMLNIIFGLLPYMLCLHG